MGTKLQRLGSRVGSTFLSNTSLARRQITTFDNFGPAMVSLNLRISSDIPVDKMKDFQRAVQEYATENRHEWIDIVSMEAAHVSVAYTDYTVHLQHRQALEDVDAVRESRVKLQHFCHHLQKQLGVNSAFRHSIVKGLKDISTTTFDDELSSASAMDNDNELYFLADSTQ